MATTVFAFSGNKTIRNPFALTLQSGEVIPSGNEIVSVVFSVVTDAAYGFASDSLGTITTFIIDTSGNTISTSYTDGPYINQSLSFTLTGIGDFSSLIGQRSFVVYPYSNSEQQRYKITSLKMTVTHRIKELLPEEKVIEISGARFSPEMAFPSQENISFIFDTLTNAAGSSFTTSSIYNLSLINIETQEAVSNIAFNKIDSNSINFNAPPEVGEYAIRFNILVRGDLYSDYYESSNEINLTVTNEASYFINFTNFTIAGKTENIYVGSKGDEAILAAWTIDNPYDKIDSIDFYQYNDEEQVLIDTGEELSFVAINTADIFDSTSDRTFARFQVEAFSSTLTPSIIQSDSIIVNKIIPNNWDSFKIDNESNYTISLPLKTVVATWTVPTLSVGTGTVSSYGFYYKASSQEEFLLGDNLSANLSTFSYTLPEFLKNERYVIIKLIAKIQATDGGYEEIESNEVRIILVGNPNPPSFSGYYDIHYTKEISDNLKIPFAYNGIHFIINSATENVENGSGKNFKYSLKYFTSGGTVNTISLPNTTSGEEELFTYDFDFSSYEEKTSLTFNILAEDIDNPGVVVSSENVVITKFEKPVPKINSSNIVALNTNDYNTQMINEITLNMSFQRSIYDNFSSNIQYLVRLYMEVPIIENMYEGFSGEIESHQTDTQITFSFTCPKSEDLDKATTTNFERNAYSEIIIKQNPEAAFGIVVSCWYKDYAQPIYSTSKATTFNFRRPVPELSSLSYTINYPENRNYFNAYEPFTINITPTSWTDAAGEVIGGDILYSLTRDGGSISLPIEGLQAEDSYNYGEQDSSISYKLVHTISYAGAKNGILSNSKETTFMVKIARWAEEEVGMRNIIMDGENASGYITFTGGAYPSGSELYMNTILTNAKYEVRNNDAISGDDDKFIVASGDITLDQIQANEIYFEVPYEHLSGSLYAIIKFQNTAETWQNSQSAIYIIRDAAATLAIRKGRLGINVSSSFGENDSILDTLQINQKDQADIGTPVVTIKANQMDTRYENSFIDFKNIGNDSYGKIYELNGLLHFEGGNKVESIILTPSNFSDNGEYIINNSYITKNSIQEIFLAGDITLEQYFAFNDSCLIGTIQDNGYCIIKALGQIPEIDIPVTILIRGV